VVGDPDLSRAILCLSFPCLVLVAALPFVAGCGLDAYEAQMEKQQKRLEYIDELNKYLGAKVEIPQPKGPIADSKKGPTTLKGPTPAPDLFLRLPKGLDNNGKATPLGPHYYTFAGSAGARPVAPQPMVRGQPVARSAPTLVDVGFRDAFVIFNTDTRNKFKDLLKNFGDIDFAVPKNTILTKNNPLHGPEVKLNSWKFKDAQNLIIFVFVYQPNDTQGVAIVYRIPADKYEKDENVVASALDYSLRTLALGTDAATALAMDHPAHF
jgi:hypothetical protein